MEKLSHILIINILFLCASYHLSAQVCWSSVGNGLGVSSQYNYEYVAAMTTYNGKLIAGGVLDTVNGLPQCLAMWDGSSWMPIPGLNTNIVGNGPPLVNVMAVYNGELYVAGSFDSAGGIPVNGFAKWNGSNWSGVGNTYFREDSNYASIASLVVYNNMLYASGQFDTVSGIAVNNIAKWNGSTWSDVAGGIKGQPGEVRSMSISDGKLYAGGNFDSAGTTSATNIAVWNGTIWSSLGSGIPNLFYNFIGGIYSITPYRGDIYAAGFAYDVNHGMYRIIRWNDSSWAYIAGEENGTYPTTVFGMFGTAYSLFVYDNLLLAGGNFMSILDTLGTNNNSGIGITASNLAAWNGSSWSEFGGGVAGVNSYVYVMDTFQGRLFVGGTFSQVDSTTAINIVQDTCPSTLPNTDIVQNAITDFQLYPNPCDGLITVTYGGDGASIDIYDISGQKVFQRNIKVGSTTIDFSALSKGVYIYQISDPYFNSIYSGKLILQ